MTNRRTFQIQGSEVAYGVRYTAKARRVSLRISANGGLVVVVPKHVSRSAIDFDLVMRSKSDWILGKLDLINTHQRAFKRIAFVSGTTLGLLGTPVTLRVFQSTGKRARVWLEGDCIVISSPSVDEVSVRNVVVAWYTHVAKRAIPERVEVLNRQLRFEYQRVTIRDQKSRWGSCSRLGTLSFNWRMLLIPSSVMDYLIYHELAHRKEMNHGVRFWRLVEEICPTYRESERWLKKFGRGAFW